MTVETGGFRQATDTAEAWDVLVIGGGGAGLAAAIEARELGRSVLLVEKNPRLGGSTAWSVGSITATATPHQIRRGIKDCPEHHYLDMVGFSGDLAPRDNDRLRRMLCEAMPDTFRWLLDKGIRFFGPMAEPPHRKPRMHTVLPNSASYIYHLERHARRVGVTIRCDTRAVDLLLADGRVVGAVLDGPAGRGVATARGAVILAAGDFTASRPLKARFMSDEAAAVEAVNPTATGDGQEMALKLGARVVNGDLALGPEIRFVPPPQPGRLTRLPPWRLLASTMAWSLDHLPMALLRPFVMGFLTTALAPSTRLFEEGALLVAPDGTRLDGPVARLPYAIAAHPAKQAYILLDGNLAKQFDAWPNFISTAPGIAYAYFADYRRNRRDLFHQAHNPTELADALGMRHGALADAIRQHHDDHPAIRPFRPPYYALGPVRPVFVHAEGGLAVNERLEVLKEGGEPIAGLLAAGSTGQGGLLLKGHGHHLAWAFTSGRLAGRLAALAVTSADPGG